MSSRFIVEAESGAVGIALRCSGGYRFFASAQAFRALERRIFPRLRALLQAVRTLDRTLGFSRA